MIRMDRITTRTMCTVTRTFRTLTFFGIAQWIIMYVSAQDPDSYLCNGNIVLMASNIQEDNRCNHVSPSPTTWDRAWDFCHARDGWMVNCPSCSQGQGAYIGEELLAYNGIASIWSGLHIKSGRLRQDDLPINTVLGALREGWNTTGALDGGQCVVEEYQELDCQGVQATPDETEGGELEPNGPNIPDIETDTTGELQRKKRRRKRRRRRRRSAPLPGKIPENCLPVYRQRIVPCDESHTFACYFSGINSFFFMDFSILEDLVIFRNDGLDREFFLTSAKGRLEHADDICDLTVSGARALRARSEDSHRVVLRALSTAVQTRANNGQMGFSLEDLKRTLYWYHQQEEGEEVMREAGVPTPATSTSIRGNKETDDDDIRYAQNCMAALLSFSYSGSEQEGEGAGPDTGDNFATMTWPCTASLPFLCEVPLNKEDTPAPVVSPVLGPNIPDFAVNVVGNEIQILANFAAQSPFALYCTIPPGFSKTQAITAYRNGVPIRVLEWSLSVEREFDDFIIPTQIAGNPILHMNVYHCEVNNKLNNQIVKSNEMFVRISDFLVYAFHIGVVESRKYQSTWDRVYEVSLAGQMANFTGDNPIPLPIDTESRLTSNVFTRLTQIIEGGDWDLQQLDFLMSPTPHLVLYLYRFQFMDGEGEGFEPDYPDYPGNPDYPDNQVQVDGQKRMDDSYTEIFFLLLSQESLIPELNVSTMRLYSIESCWSKNITVESVGRQYSLPETAGGSVWASPQTCAQDGEPLVTVECEGSKRRGYDWGTVKVNPSCDYPTNTAMDSEITEELQTVSQENVTKDNVDEILEKTKELTDQVSDSELQPIDVTLIADILQKSSEVDDLTTDQATEILEAATRLTNLDQDVLEEAQEMGLAASRVIKSVDDLGASVQVTDESKFSRLVTENLALEVWDLTKDYDRNTIIGLEVLSDGSAEVIDVNDLISLFSPSGLDYGKAEAAILLPKEFIESQLTGAQKNASVRLAMNVYADTGLYQQASTDPRGRNVSLNSKVIAAKVLVNGIPITDLGPYNVTTVFLPKVKVPEEDRNRYSACAWWDFEASGGYGAWSTRGCSYQRAEAGRDVCVCDHLTNFAILVSFYDQDSIDEDDDLALGIISIVGLVLSIVGLSVSIISFLCIKKLREGRPQQTLFNLAIALLLSWIVFLAGIGRTENHAGCIAVAAILHYLIMASFLWMLMEGILQYLLFVRVMNTYFTNYMVKTAVPAWGLPVIPVMIVLAIDPELYRGGERYCWMSLDAFYYAFAIPVGVIILANLAIFLMVVVSLCRRKDMTKHSSQSESQAFVNFRASFICFFILGLSWIFGFLTIEDARTVFQYVFCITSSLQGFVIFLMMTARNKAIRTFWKDKCCGPCLGDGQKGKTYRTWGDKGTGSSSNSGVPSVARHNKTYLDSTTSQTNLSTSEQQTPSSTRPDPTMFPMGVKRKGYGNESVLF